MEKLSLIILSVLFFAVPYAEAQPPTDPKDMESMRAFVETAKTGFLEIGDEEFRKAAAVEGEWKQDTTYLIVLERDGYVVSHAYDRDSEDRDLSSQSPVAEVLNSPGECIKYDDYEGVSGRYACSVEIEIERLGGSFIMVAGLHTAPLPEVPFEELVGSNYVPEIQADEVKDAETLKRFVDGALEAIVNNFGVSRAEAPHLTRFRPLLRREGGPWNQGDIYIYVMLGNLVIFNGNNRALDDTTLDITDRNGCNVGEEIHRVIAGEDRECKSLGLLPQDSDGYLEYLWDNPDIEGDEDERFLESQEFSPGFTPKLGYVKSFTTPQGISLIVGSGVYPVAESDGGCTVAGPNEVLPAGLLVIFLLVGVAICLKVFDKFNGRNIT